MDLRPYLFIVGYAVCLFALAVVLVPADMEGVEDSYDYLVNGRHWIFGVMLVAHGFDIADTFVKGTGWALRPIYLWQISLFIVAAVIAMTTTKRHIQLPTAAVALAVNVGYIFLEIGILGGW